MPGGQNDQGRCLWLLALGFTAEEFVAAYQHNRAELLDTAVEASPVARALVRFMDRRERWEGSATALLGELATLDPGAAHSPGWPRSAKGLLGALGRLGPALRAGRIDCGSADHAEPLYRGVQGRKKRVTSVTCASFR